MYMWLLKALSRGAYYNGRLANYFCVMYSLSFATEASSAAVSNNFA